jgi:hydroxyacylglutathione hydrolase
MEYAALGLALVALIVALAARSKAGGLAKSVEDAASDARRRVENANSERTAEVEVLKKQLAQIARGEKVSEDMILEGRTWRDANTKEGVALVASGNVRIVDVRTRKEMAAGIIPGALLIPIDELEARVKEIPRDGQTILVYCASGARSAAACEYLSREGYDGLLNLQSGFLAWNGPKATVG